MNDFRNQEQRKRDGRGKEDQGTKEKVSFINSIM